MNDSKIDSTLFEAEEEYDYYHEMSNVRDSFVAVAFVAAVIVATPLPMW